ncbi:MAG: hypothetical protein KF709_12380 [Gemmatimonadaceae bacterium]|nr:hypothetical protein [Gemmatimonadaceae bacterium]
MSPERLPPALWADEGQRAAPALAEVAAAIVTGRDPEAAAAVALGLARAHAAERRVAIADLVGGIPALTPLADQPGLLECLRDGHPVSDIGQALPGLADVYVLPSGNGPIAERWVMESRRWERLIGGFREADALLLLVVPPHAPGIASLIAQVDGVVAVDLPPAELRAWPLLATVDHPEPELPPIIPAAGRAADADEARPVGVDGARGGTQPRLHRGLRQRPRRVGRWILAATLALGATGWWWLNRAERSRLGSASPVDSSAAPAPIPDSAAGAEREGAAPEATAPAPRILEVTLGPLVNPSDSLAAQRFTVELVAANTLTSANSTLRFPSGTPPVATVSPVLLGATPRPWYRALAGAWQTRDEAEAWLAARRATGEVREGVGRVLEAPYALVLADGLSTTEASALVAEWEMRGVASYALRQEAGRVRVYAGAFETVGQAAWLASTLRDVTGELPRVAYRTGRMF